MNRKKRILAIIIAAAIVCGAVVGVSAAVRRTTSGGKVMVVSADELNYGYGYLDGDSMEGYVTSERTQNVRLSSTQSVKEINVEEGQDVKKGDVLLTYDMTQTEINLEKAQLKLELLKQNLKTAEDALKKLRNTSPSSGDGEDDADLDDGDDADDDDEKAKPVKKPKAASELTGKSKPYYDAESAAAPGTEENPYRFLVKAGATVNADFINMVKKLQEEKQSCYFVLELRENDSWEGRLIRSWTQDASDVISPDKDWIGIIDPDNEKPIIPTKTFAEIEEMEKQAKENKEKIEALEKELKELKEKQEEAAEAAQTPEPTDVPDASDASGDSEQTIADLTAQIEALQEENAQLQARIDELEQQSGTTDQPDDTGIVDGEDTESSSSSGAAAAEEIALRRAVSEKVTDGIYRTAPAAASAVYRKITPVSAQTALLQENSGAVAVLTDFEEIDDDLDDLDDLDDMSDDSDDEDDEDEEDSAAGSLDTFDSEESYSSEELKDAVKSQEESIADLKLDIREAELKVKSAEKALENGTVKAVLDGVVTRVEDIDSARVNGTPVISVAGASGVAIKGGLPEKYLDTIHEGDVITVASWTTGMQYQATITEISPYPDTSGMFDGGMSYNNSSYPFVAIIDDEDAEMEENDWVQISVDANTLAQDDGFYLMRAFILEEGNRAYVYKRGEDGLLHSQDVKLGKLSGDSYEILGGVTAEDWVAFPYGKNIKEGAQTREGTMEELYNS